MQRNAPILAWLHGVAALFLVLVVSIPAHADSPEPASMEGFGKVNPTCLEWSDGCAVCRRDEAGQDRCSTPGIACQPGEVVCRASKP